ncbi:helicase-related protein [Tsukamurella soli]|uniref:Helicase-related protein n=1 Tax=Tsukamurella soli TaxID=644556 RepID=A0ABP8K4U8_9ACTN
MQWAPIVDPTDLAGGQRLRGLIADEITVVAVEPNGPGSATVTYRTDAGRLGDRVVTVADVAGIEVRASGARWGFDGDAEKFSAAMEANRIRMAGRYDPMMALATSTVRPLPHQIRAVYEELLPRTPLRFLLADDPGAGKTVMAGLYAKELMLRGDCRRLLIVAPGGLVDQWQDELRDKFGIDAVILTRELVAVSHDGDPFPGNPVMIARMDQLARSDELCTHLERSHWDLVVVDEAHRMSANWYGGEIDKTRRYQLGEVLGRVARHMLLMSATPHAGKEDSFQAFLALLDPDRFAGQYRAEAHRRDTSGLMRRMVKEELLTFEGRPLFPERRAETVPYTLSPGELALYEAVTAYVRNEMNRADAVEDGRRRTVGFALTVLQRRLASSTHAVTRSLERRRARLGARRHEMDWSTPDPAVTARPQLLKDAMRYDTDEYDAEEIEQLEEDVLDAATAARSLAELDAEILALDELVALARRVREAGTDTKWAQLSSLFHDPALRGPDGRPRKIIVFTEHRDTLDYLTERLRNLLGDPDAVQTIHGGTHRLERKQTREEFTNEPGRLVLVATDAAGEGLNLQAAHLMVNYDLPWNPNRIEQRFGRIHRIGQEHVCRLWNLVAAETREGQVFTRLLQKMEEQRKAYGGKLFDVLGEAFADTPLAALMLDAIRYGDDPARREEIERVVDAQVADGCHKLVEERALAREGLGAVELERIRRQMEEAQARRLQPHYVHVCFERSFRALGGRMVAREGRRFEIRHVPATIRERAAVPLASAYHRVTFEPDEVRGTGRAAAELLAPGSPLLDTVLELIAERGADAVAAGTVLFDADDPGDQPRLVVALTETVVDGLEEPVSRRFSYVEIRPDGSVTDAGPGPYNDLTPLPDEARDAAARVLAQPWLSDGVERRAASWAADSTVAEHTLAVRQRLEPEIAKTRNLVRARLTEQMNYLYRTASDLRSAAPDKRRRRLSPDTLEAQARELERRLTTRLADLDAQARLSARPPVLTGAAVVIPAGLVGGEFGRYARDTAATERRAVDLVLAAEREIGRVPVEMPHNNKGYDVMSTAPDGSRVFIEVKGRVSGADTFEVTFSEVMFGKNMGREHRLALVSVHPDGAAHDAVRYLTDRFRTVDIDAIGATRVTLDWRRTWEAGLPPH